MKRKRHTPEEIIKKLREAVTQLAGGQSVEAVCKKLEGSPPTYHRWRQEYGGGREETVKRLKALEKENTQIKKLVATQTRKPNRNSHSNWINNRGHANSFSKGVMEDNRRSFCVFTVRTSWLSLPVRRGGWRWGATGRHPSFANPASPGPLAPSGGISLSHICLPPARTPA